MKLTKSEKELLEDISNFEIDISINDTYPVKKAFAHLLRFELESMKIGNTPVQVSISLPFLR